MDNIIQKYGETLSIESVESNTKFSKSLLRSIVKEKIINRCLSV